MALPRIVLFGDSLTQWSFDETCRGFGWALRTAYEGKAEVLNEGVAGYTSTWLKPQFASIIAEAKRDYECGISTLFITIFLGANDACLPDTSVHVPLREFEENLREYVDDILTEESLEETKVILIAPPPINIPKSLPDSLDVSSSDAPDDDLVLQKRSRGFLTYMSKKRYAEKVMAIAKSYEEITNRVAGLDYWTALTNTVQVDMTAANGDNFPGSGLSTAREFPVGYFTDGLHLDRLSYDCLTGEVMTLIERKWPEMSPFKLGSSAITTEL